jgi:hypothetical protein
VEHIREPADGVHLREECEDSRGEIPPRAARELGQDRVARLGEPEVPSEQESLEGLLVARRREVERAPINGRDDTVDDRPNVPHPARAARPQQEEVAVRHFLVLGEDEILH